MEDKGPDPGWLVRGETRIKLDFESIAATLGSFGGKVSQEEFVEFARRLELAQRSRDMREDELIAAFRDYANERRLSTKSRTVLDLTLEQIAEILGRDVQWKTAKNLESTLDMLRRDHNTTAREISNRLGVRMRQIYRYKKDLRKLGFRY